MDATATVEGIRLLALRPGDRLAVMLPVDTSFEDIEHMQDTLKESWPDVPTVYFVGDIELTVVRPDA